MTTMMTTMMSAVSVDKLYHVDGDTHTMEGFADTDEGYQMKDAGGQPHFALVVMPMPTVHSGGIMLLSRPFGRFSIRCPSLSVVCCTFVNTYFV